MQSINKPTGTIFMFDLMIFRLYLPAILVLVLGFLSWIILGVFIPYKMSNIPIFSELVTGSSKFSTIVFAISTMVAIYIAIYQTYTLWKWRRGSIGCCFSCGGIVAQKYGRYGLYEHCLACGKNRRI
ncbi:MAG: hypothetical protein H6974_12380 [Gammaproteobacteria bacterium]|nr:hypothetical protein [Gammaproteobacteria bacterium]